MAALKDWGFQMMANNFNLATNCRCDIVCGIKETDKAIYGLFYVGFDGTGSYAKRRCGWVPKSAIENIDALKMISDYDDAVAYFQSNYCA